jgi:hypothetical protein
MKNSYGPWATLIDAGGNPQLSAFWRRRLTMLVPASQASAVLSRRNLLWLGGAGLLTGFLPTLRLAPAMTEEKKPAAADQKSSAGSAYEKEWDKRVKLFNVPIKKTDGPATFALDFAPPVGTRFRMISLVATYPARGHFPQLPHVYMVADGRITVIAPVEDNRPAVLIRAQEKVFESPRHHEEKPCGTFVLVPRPDGFDCFDLDHGAPKKVLPGKVNAAALACSGFATRPRYIPNEKSFAVGIKWLLPEKSHGAEVPCEIVGFAEVAGRETVKIVAEKHLTNQEFQHFITWEHQQEKEAEIGPKGFDYDAATKQSVKRIAEKEMTMALRFVYYVDRKTGITVRCEKQWTYYYAKGTRENQNQTLISQVLDE